MESCKTLLDILVESCKITNDRLSEESIDHYDIEEEGWFDSYDWDQDVYEDEWETYNHPWDNLHADYKSGQVKIIGVDPDMFCDGCGRSYDICDCGEDK